MPKQYLPLVPKRDRPRGLRKNVAPDLLRATGVPLPPPEGPPPRVHKAKQPSHITRTHLCMRCGCNRRAASFPWHGNSRGETCITCTPSHHMPVAQARRQERRLTRAEVTFLTASVPAWALLLPDLRADRWGKEMVAEVPGMLTDQWRQVRAQTSTYWDRRQPLEALDARTYKRLWHLARHMDRRLR